MTNKINFSNAKLIKKLEGSNVRSNISLLEVDEQKFVKKHFNKKSDLLFLKNEIKARKVLKHEAISPILEHGDDYIIMPFFEETNRFKNTGLDYYPIDRARKIMEFIAWLNSQGYAMIDWNYGAFLFDKNDNLKVIDFEYLSEVPKEKNFEKSADFNCAAEYLDSTADVKIRRTSYKYLWQPIIGVSYQTLMNGSDFKISAIKAIHFLSRKLPRFLYKRAENFVKTIAKGCFGRKRNTK